MRSWVVTIAAAGLALFFLVFAGLALNPFGDPTADGRIVGWALAVAGVPLSGAGAFVAYRSRRETGWLILSVALALATAIYLIVVMPSA